MRPLRTRFGNTPAALAVSAAAALLSALLLTSCDHGPRHLSQRSEVYRYALTRAIPDVVPCPQSTISVDFDQDGIDEEIKFAAAAGGASYMMVSRVGEGRHYALFSRNFLTSAGLCGVADVTGDGVPEIVWWEQPSRELMRINVSHFEIEGATGRDSTMACIEWEPDEGVMPDGSWGSLLPLLAAFDTDDDGAADVLAIGFCAGIARRPRGVWFWDLREGHFSKRVALAGTPSGGVQTGDIDADGSDELVVGTGAPANGVTEGAWDDSHSYVMAFEAEGTIKWWREQAGYTSDVHVLIDDLDGDGTVEVVTGVGGHSEQDLDRYGAYVLRGTDGEVLGAAPTGSSVNDLASMSCPGGRRLFTGSADGLVRRFMWDGAVLTLDAVLDCGDAVDGLAALPMGTDPSVERLVAATAKGEVAVLDVDLSPLAFTDMGDGTQEVRKSPLSPVNVSVEGRAEPAVMIIGKTRLHRFRVVKRPLPFWMTIALPFTGVIAALCLIPRTRRTAVAGLRRWLLPRASRGEAIDALLNSLAAASHGKLAATSTLRRLREQFRMLQNYEGDPPAVFTERFEHAVGDVRQVGVPGIEGIVGGAERLGLAPTHATSLRRSVAALDRLLGELPHGPPSRKGASVLGERLDDLLPGIESALVTIRGAARLERSSDPGAEFERAMAARAPEFEELGVEVTFEGRDVLAGIRVCGTPGEISFILENLLGNAVEAMKDGGVRKLRISARADGDRIQLRVSDTGKGIRDEDRQHIFVSGWSGTRSGGGQGLPMSREVLARRGGTLDLLESSPGEGAVFGLTLVVCQGGSR